MAGWGTHIILADRLLSDGLAPYLDRRGFVVGAIAPDCNIENADWSDFTPPRETTHFMTGKSKITADYEGFYTAFIKGCHFRSEEHRAFLWGYYTHLVTDVMFTKYLHDAERIAACFARLSEIESYQKQLADQPKTYDTLKTVFGNTGLMQDLSYLEYLYLSSDSNHPYHTVLRKVTAFPDYLPFLPTGAIVRKIKIMAHPITDIPKTQLLFFSKEEYAYFLDAVCEKATALIKDRIS